MGNFLFHHHAPLWWSKVNYKAVKVAVLIYLQGSNFKYLEMVLYGLLFISTDGDTRRATRRPIHRCVKWQPFSIRPLGRRPYQDQLQVKILQNFLTMNDCKIILNFLRTYVQLFWINKFDDWFQIQDWIQRGRPCQIWPISKPPWTSGCGCRHLQSLDLRTACRTILLRSQELLPTSSQLCAQVCRRCRVRDGRTCGERNAHPRRGGGRGVTEQLSSLTLS